MKEKFHSNETSVLPISRVFGQKMLSESDKIDTAVSLSHFVKRKLEVEAEKKEKLKEYKVQLDKLSTEISALENALVNGFRTCEIDCYVKRNWKTQRKRFICIKTHEVIKEVPFSDEDKQMDISDLKKARV